MKKEDRMEMVIYIVIVAAVGFIGMKFLFPTESAQIIQFPSVDKEAPKVPTVSDELKTFGDGLTNAKKETDKHTEILTVIQARIEVLEKTIQKQNEIIDKQSETLRVKMMSMNDLKGSVNHLTADMKRIHEREDKPQPITLKFEGALPIEVKSVPPLQRAPAPTPPVAPPKDIKKLNGVKNAPLFTQSPEVK